MTVHFFERLEFDNVPLLQFFTDFVQRARLQPACAPYADRIADNHERKTAGQNKDIGIYAGIKAD